MSQETKDEILICKKRWEFMWDLVLIIEMKFCINMLEVHVQKNQQSSRSWMF